MYMYIEWMAFGTALSIGGKGGGGGGGGGGGAMIKHYNAGHCSFKTVWSCAITAEELNIWDDEHVGHAGFGNLTNSVPGVRM